MLKLVVLPVAIFVALACLGVMLFPENQCPNQRPHDKRFENRGKRMLQYADNRFSSHWCVGGRDYEAWGPYDKVLTRHLSETPPTDVQALTCVFRNVRYSGRGAFEYFIAPNGAFPFDFANNGTVQSQPWPKGPTIGYHHRPISLVSAPQGTMVPKKSDVLILDERVFVIGTMGPAHKNIGHQMIDGSWLALEAMQRMQMMDPSNLMLVEDLDESKFLAYSLISSERALALPNLPVGKVLPWLVVGSARGCINNALNHLTPPLMGILGDLGRLVWQRRYVSESHSSGPPVIIVRRKDHRHGFTNHDALITFLRARYPKHVVWELNPPTTSFKEEMDNVLFRAVVYITPCGGGSFTLPYLQDGATAIVGSYCWRFNPGQNENKGNPEGTAVQCRQLERHMWALLPNIHMRYYSFKGSASRLRHTQDAPEPNYMPELDYSYPVDLQVMGRMVDEALLRWGDKRV